jgi:hypothetical protein
VQEDELVVGDCALQLDYGGLEQLCLRLKSPPDYLARPSPDIRSGLINHHLAHAADALETNTLNHPDPEIGTHPCRPSAVRAPAALAGPWQRKGGGTCGTAKDESRDDSQTAAPAAGPATRRRFP